MSTPSNQTDTIETDPMVAIEFEDASKAAKARTGGTAISTPKGGTAMVSRYGVAFAVSSGTVNGGAAGVSVTRNGGLSLSGDGGASIAYEYGSAACGAHGVAFCKTPGPVGLGRVKGGAGATLVISWVVKDTTNPANDMTFSKSVRVGETADGDGIEIVPGT
jgi:hypothetical protein